MVKSHMTTIETHSPNVDVAESSVLLDWRSLIRCAAHAEKAGKSNQNSNNRIVALASDNTVIKM